MSPDLVIEFLNSAPFPANSQPKPGTDESLNVEFPLSQLMKAFHPHYAMKERFPIGIQACIPFPYIRGRGTRRRKGGAAPPAPGNKLCH